MLYRTENSHRLGTDGRFRERRFDYAAGTKV